MYFLVDLMVYEILYYMYIRPTQGFLEELSRRSLVSIRGLTFEHSRYKMASGIMLA